MEHIWQEMAETMMAKDPSMFANDYAPEDLAAAMADAWGMDRAAAVWELEDVLVQAEECEVDLTEDEARAVMHDLTDSLTSYNGYDILSDILAAFQQDTDDDWEADEYTF